MLTGSSTKYKQERHLKLALSGLQISGGSSCDTGSPIYCQVTFHSVTLWTTELTRLAQELQPSLSFGHDVSLTRPGQV